jgi:hypothetical protein
MRRGIAPFARGCAPRAMSLERGRALFVPERGVVVPDRLALRLSSGARLRLIGVAREDSCALADR